MSQQTSTQANTLEERIAAIAGDVISNAGHFLVDITVRGVRGSRVVEIFVDGEEGVGLDDLAKYSREIGFMLDTEDFIDGRYKLEVSSPGLDRPLQQPRQYKKHLDRKLKVKMETSEGTKVLEGVLSKVAEEGIELTHSNKEVRQIAFTEIMESKVLLPW